MSGPLEIIGEQSSALEPIPTGLEPRIPILRGVRAVVFDIYGTLFVSGSGDIGLAVQEDSDIAMREVFEREGLHVPGGAVLSEAFHGLIRESHDQGRARGADFPEVEIREIWRRLLAALDVPPCGDALIERIAVRFETRVNPVWPMPEAGSVLTKLRDRGGLSLGIISNAQFYTPLLFQHFLGDSARGLGFEDDLCVWSYREGAAKPSPSLFTKLTGALAERGIAPGEALYAGNDMRNDILPAAAAGLRTALFAGDQRSLRLRDHQAGQLPCDLILTRLGQLPGCIA